ncbi:hypothetical protein VT84_33225 [Gemmata sp. SH-PL17]|uniref:hypothetical protein n=1 Tax=Gemmata sp. SH-PL17 TaxID=1630693 RepID=UPI00078C23CC|nr:hypothetical protein [Gemmata sp. SH-PL17]AMV29305.1 hypothetical protein VT84_33225 [Gemmata sp. SH-PL17]
MNSIAKALEHIHSRGAQLDPHEQRELAEQLAEEAETLTDMADAAERDSYLVDDPDERTLSKR